MNVTVEDWTHSAHAITLAYRVGDERVTKTCTYDSVDFDSFDAATLDRLCTQLAMMEAIPFAGFAPERIELGPASERFVALWKRVLRGSRTASISCIRNSTWCGQRRRRGSSRASN